MPSSRLALAALTGALVLLSACGRHAAAPTSPDTTASATSSVPSYVMRSGGQSLVGMFHLELDPSTMTPTVTPIVGRTTQAQPPQNFVFDLDIANFLNKESFNVTGLETDIDGNLVVSFTHAHPFGAPNFANQISGTNRADLGYTGQLLLLADSTSEAFFAGGTTLDPTMIVAPDGYMNPTDLLSATGLTNNTFPYVLLADDGEDNRVGVTNGGTPSGSYDIPGGGWQRSNIGGTNDGWTGFDYIHGGQTIANSFTVSKGALANGLSLDVAILIKYVDPRGQTGKTRRFPPEPADVSAFAYRLPYASLDVSKMVADQGSYSVGTTIGSLTGIQVDMRDWDAGATEAASADLGAETDVSLIEPGASGTPVLELDAPALSSTASTLLAGSGTGLPGDEIAFAGSITNALGTAADGIYYACLRATDPSDAIDDSGYHFGVDPDLITPTRTAVDYVRYQVVPVLVGNVSGGFVITGVTPAGDTGCPGSNVPFSATVTGGVATSWSWSFGGGATPNTSTSATPNVTTNGIGVYTGAVVASGPSGTTPPFIFNYSVTSALATHLPPTTVGGNTGLFTEAVIYDGRPVVVHIERNPIAGSGVANVVLTAANVANPTAPADWTTHVVRSGTDSATLDTFVGLCVVQGRLIVVSKDDVPNNLMASVATVTAPATPTSGAQWSTYILQASGGSNIGQLFHIEEVNDRAVVTYYDATGGDLRLAQSTNNNPASGADWQIMTLAGATNNSGNWACPYAWNDGSGEKIVVGYRNSTTGDLEIARALTATPTFPIVPAEWQYHVIDSLATNNTGRWIDVTSFNNGTGPRLAITSLEFTRSMPMVYIATALNPTVEADWLKVDLPPAATVAGGGFGMSITQSSNYLIMAFHYYAAAGDGNLGLAIAKTTNPLATADFDISFHDVAGLGGAYPSVVTLGSGEPAVMYRDTSFSNVTGVLKYGTPVCDLF